MFQIPKLQPTRPIEKSALCPGVFNQEEIDRILFFEKILNFGAGQVGSPGTEQVAEDVRKCKTAYFHQDSNTQWLWEKVANIVVCGNYDVFLYDIELIETLQYTIYEGSDSDHYTWHADATVQGYNRCDRKISGTIMLSDPEDYVGGDFEIDLAANFKPQTIKLNKGDMFLFDSQRTHCVKPVTSGKRKTIVFWVSGSKGTL